jgi:hypothetical protein
MTAAIERGYTEEIVKKGRRTYGSLRTYLDGRKVYLAWRKQNEIYRSGRASISDAMRDGVAGWAVDDETLLAMRSKVVPFIGVLVRETGEIYLTYTDAFFERGPTKRWFMQNHVAKCGSLQRVMPLQAFMHKPGVVTLKKGVSSTK